MGIELSNFAPRHKGEKAVNQQLATQDDNSLYFWSSLDFIPGVNDIDLLIWHKDIGCFVVEIKAIPIDMLVSFGFSTCEISGRGIDRSPQNQAYDALQSLRNYLVPVLNKMPFMVATVCWPLISRFDWNECFKHSLEIRALSDSMIMKDDLYSSKEIFSNKLKDIWIKPPIRKGSDYPFRHDSNLFNSFCAVLDAKAIPKAIATDITKLEALEKGIKRELIRNFPPHSNTKVLFHGRPGTGKTFRLQQIAIMHAREGAKVLLCCFNQVLASEFIRFINLLDLRFKSAGVESSIKEFIDIIDITSLTLRVCSDLGLHIESNDFGEWGQLIIEELKNSGALINYPSYDTLLIDESQDFSDWQIELALLLSVPDATIVMGVGSGQELYLKNEMSNLIDQCDFQQFKNTYLRRNFRNSKPIYELAHLIYECNFESNKIINTYTKNFSNKKTSANEIEFDISEANFPSLFYINDELDIQYDQPSYDEQLIYKLASEYKNVILSQLNSTDHNSNDILILVPDTVGDEIKAARIALKELKSDNIINYIDYVEKKSRKQIAPEGNLRIVTFHSSRGLEASKVIVLGIEKLQFISRATSGDQYNLGYITISRAIFDLIICIRSSRRNQITNFIEDAITYITSNYV